MLFNLLTVAKSMELLKVSATMGQSPKVAQDAIADVKGTNFAEIIGKVHPDREDDQIKTGKLNQANATILNDEGLQPETTASDANLPGTETVLAFETVPAAETVKFGEGVAVLPTGRAPDIGQFGPARKNSLTDDGFRAMIAEHRSNTSILPAVARNDLSMSLPPIQTSLAGETVIVVPQSSASIFPAGIATAHSIMPMAAQTGAMPNLPVSVIAELPHHVAQHISSSPRNPERLVVQLDPPELGRVSIDFQYDGRGMQQVLVTGESPEAVRQLRMMQAELVQSLDRFGIGGGNLLFEQSGSDNGRNGTGEPRFGKAPPGEDSGSPIERADAEEATGTHSGRLDQANGLDLRL